MKLVKKIFFALLTAALLTSCSQEEEKENPDTNIEASLVGVWKIQNSPVDKYDGFPTVDWSIIELLSDKTLNIYSLETYNPHTRISDKLDVKKWYVKDSVLYITAGPQTYPTYYEESYTVTLSDSSKSFQNVDMDYTYKPYDYTTDDYYETTQKLKGTDWILDESSWSLWDPKCFKFNEDDTFSNYGEGETLETLDYTKFDETATFWLILRGNYLFFSFSGDEIIKQYNIINDGNAYTSSITTLNETNFSIAFVDGGGLDLIKK